MALIVDAGVLYAQADAGDGHHLAAAQLLRNESEQLVTSESAVAEADYLILNRLGLDAELAFLDDLAEGTFTSACLSVAELAQARLTAAQYSDLRLGLADCSLVVLAKRYGTRRIATFNQRHFCPLAPLQGGSFVVLPADR